MTAITFLKIEVGVLKLKLSSLLIIEKKRTNESFGVVQPPSTRKQKYYKNTFVFWLKRELESPQNTHGILFDFQLFC